MTPQSTDIGQECEGVWRRSPWLTVVRDVLCLGLGVWGVIREEVGGHPDLTRLLFFAALMVSPGLIAAAWLGRTGARSISSPSEPSSPPSSLPGGET
jgi:hypothetical protein